MRFRSKIGTEFVAIIGITFGGMLFVMIREGLWLGTLLPVAILVYLVYLSLTTFYRIEDGFIVVKSGFWNKKINLSRVRKIRDSGDLSSSPALSVDRIEIVYDRFETLVISPKDKNGFIGALLEAQPDLEVTVKQWCGEAQRNL